MAKGAEASAEKVVKDIRRKTRRRFSTEEKIRIVLGVSERTLRKWMRDEGLPYSRVDGAVRLPVAELRRWMLERTASQHTSDEIAEQMLRDL